MRIQIKVFGLTMLILGLFTTKSILAGTGFGISQKFTLDTKEAVPNTTPASTPETTPTVINVSVRIKPKVINLKRKGTFTAFVKFNSEYDVSDVDKSTIECNGAQAARTRVITKKNLFKSTFKVKDLEDISPGNSVLLELTGSLATGEFFKGSSLVKVINPGNER